MMPARFLYMKTLPVLLLFWLALPVSAFGRREAVRGDTPGLLREHVSRLASDEFQGRETGTPGVMMAEDYIADVFRNAGLSRVPGAGSYFLPFDLYRLTPDPAETFLRLQGTEDVRTAGKDFRPLPFSGTGRTSAGVVFAGYGITAPEYGYDDYEGLDVRGKIVLVLRHEPGENDPQSRFRGTTLTDHALFARKAKNAEQHGAAGLLLVTDPLNHAEAEDLRLRPTLSLDEAGRQGEERRPGNRTPVVGENFLALQISGELAGRLLSSAGSPLAEIQKALDSGRKPSAMVIAIPTVEAAVGKEVISERVNARNVAALLPGSDPVLRDEWIIVSAHHDHLGSFPGAGDTVYNGADDNASGVSGVLALARLFSRAGMRPARSILFITFSGEEDGLLGSRALVRSGLVTGGSAVGRAVFSLNLDMIGRNPEKPVEVYGDGFAAGVRELVETANGDVRLSLSFHGREYEPASDHDTFFRAGVPFLFFFTNLHPDYHGVDDEADRIAYDRMADIVELARGVITQLADGRQVDLIPGAAPANERLVKKE